VGLFRRSKPLHEQLAEEGGLVEAPPHDTTPRWGAAGIHGVPRPRKWDAVVAVETELEGDSASFVALPDGTIVIDDGPDDVRPLADGVETEVRPPYRAEGLRRDAGVWAVGARRIQVVELQHEGDELEVAIRDGERTLTVDGETEFGSIRELEALATGDAVVHAARIDGDLWEVQVSKL
jgi:hypothetical protein